MRFVNATFQVYCAGNIQIEKVHTVWYIWEIIILGHSSSFCTFVTDCKPILPRLMSASKARSLLKRGEVGSCLHTNIRPGLKGLLVTNTRAYLVSVCKPFQLGLTFVFEELTLERASHSIGLLPYPTVCQGNTKGGSITVPLTSCLYGLVCFANKNKNCQLPYS
jgi:hypothetical protein